MPGLRRWFNPHLRALSSRPSAVTGFFFVFVAVCAAYGVYRVLRSNARDRQYLASSKEDSPLQLEHLGTALRKLARNSRMLRISLEASIRDIADFRRGQLSATAEDVESFDNMLMNVSRAIAEWLADVDRLGERERGELADHGVSADPIRHALEAEGFAFERKHVERAGAPPMDERLRGVALELAKVEAALQVTGRGYR